MKQSHILVFLVLIVFALVGGVWEGIILNMMNIHTACGVNGHIKYESWVLAKPIELKCSVVNS